MGLSARLIAMAASLSLYAPSGHAEEFHISVLQSTTGPAAFVGKPLTDGIALAVEDVNAGQMLGAGSTLVATYADDGGDRGQAVTLLKRAAADPRVSIVIGPTTAQLGVAVSNAANDARIPIYTSGAVRDTLNAGPWAFLITPLPEDFIGEIADFAAKKLHVKKCVIMTILDSESYISLAKGFQKIVAENGTDVLAYEGVKQSDTDFSAIAVKVIGLKPDCIFVSAPAAQAANIVVRYARLASLRRPGS